jgi:hypothetical protein
VGPSDFTYESVEPGEGRKDHENAGDDHGTGATGTTGDGFVAIPIHVTAHTILSFVIVAILYKERVSERPKDDVGHDQVERPSDLVCDEVV